MPQDYAQALNWYRSAAEQGNPDGQFDVASLLEHGQGTAADVTQAIGWYRRAAEQGNAAAADAVKRLTGQTVAGKKSWSRAASKPAQGESRRCNRATAMPRRKAASAKPRCVAAAAIDATNEGCISSTSIWRWATC